MNRIKQFLKPPSPLQVRTRQLQDAELQLVMERMELERAAHSVNLLESRIERLQQEINHATQDH